jgi:hypothetical protein
MRNQIHQVSVSYVEQGLKREEDIIWDNDRIEPWDDITISQILKMHSYGDLDSTFYFI